MIGKTRIKTHIAIYDLAGKKLKQKKTNKAERMKTDLNGLQVTILKQYRQQSNNINEKINRYYDLLRVRYATGEIKVICQSELIN